MSDALPPGQWIQVGAVRRFVPKQVPQPAATKAKKRKPIEHGTERGYWWHRRNAEWPIRADDPCGCRAAHREHRATQRRKAGAAA